MNDLSFKFIILASLDLESRLAERDHLSHKFPWLRWIFVT